MADEGGKQMMDSSKIKAMIQEWKRREPGEPLQAYIYDINELVRHARRTVASLPDGVSYYYAIKANSDKPILEALLPVVDGFEVASIGEAAKVRECSDSVKIIFGGPGKTDRELIDALRLRVSLLHVESLGELQRLNWLADRLGKRVPILLRVNLRGPLPAGTLQMCGVPSQFGIDEADIPLAIELAQRCPNVLLKGFHFHSVSNQLDAPQHASMIGHYVEKARLWSQQYGFELRHINAGGGIGINFEKLEDPFDWEVFVEKLLSIADQAAAGADPSPEIIFECGRYTMASCGYYAAEVIEIRRNGDANYAILNGGLHQFLLPGAWKHRHPWEVVPIEGWGYAWPREQVSGVPVTVAGKMNSPRDILAHTERAERIRVGDVILFPYAGAYGWSISAHDFSSLEHPRFLYV
jgi:diaminopimelate decarboxylase